MIKNIELTVDFTTEMDLLQSIFLLMVLFSTAHSQCFFTGVCYTKHDKGLSYRGHENVSHSGRKCIPWNHHLHYVTPDRYPFDELENNYCRNPRGSRSSPWCYTSASGKENDSWETCNIPVCEGCLFRGVQMKEGDRFHDGCSLCICRAKGLSCLECPETKITSKMGCYIKYNNKQAFPKCCSREVCHGRDPEFDMQEYFKYLQAVLQVHQYGTGTVSGVEHRTVSNVTRNVTHVTHHSVLP